MKDDVWVTPYSWSTRYVVKRDNLATITVDIADDATPGQLAAIMRRITQEKGWT